MLPCRFILINQQAFKGVLELSVVPINASLMLHINVHQFKGVLDFHKINLKNCIYIFKTCYLN